MMHFKKACFFSALLLFLPFISMADTASAQLTQLLSGIENLKANFVQTVYNGNGGVLQRTTGQMILQRPGSFDGEIQQPSKQLLIADGSRIWFYVFSLGTSDSPKAKVSTRWDASVIVKWFSREAGARLCHYFIVWCRTNIQT